MAFHILGTCVPSSLSNAYDPDSPTRVTRYGPSQLGWNFPTAGSTVFSKTFLRTRLPGWNARGFTRLSSPVCYRNFPCGDGMTLYGLLLTLTVHRPSLNP